MSQLPKQMTPPELQAQPPQMLSSQMETQKPQSPKRLWLLSGVLVLVLIVIIAASQASNSSQSTKTTTQAVHLRVAQAQGWYLGHDTHEILIVSP